eukprot:gene30342-61690_t
MRGEGETAGRYYNVHNLLKAKKTEFTDFADYERKGDR